MANECDDAMQAAYPESHPLDEINYRFKVFSAKTDSRYSANFYCPNCDKELESDEEHNASDDASDAIKRSIGRHHYLEHMEGGEVVNRNI